MKRIVIVGSSGAGKTTLAQRLGPILQIKVVHLDRLFWQRSSWKEKKQNWQGKPRDIRVAILQKVIQEKQWIVEGTYFYSSKPALDMADTIIFLDMPLLLCLARIFKRHHESFGRSRRDLPEGSTDRLSLRSIRKVLLFPFGDGKAFKQRLQNYESKHIIRLRSPKEVDEFLAQLEHGQKSASTASPVNASSLVGSLG